MWLAGFEHRWASRIERSAYPHCRGVIATRVANFLSILSQTTPAERFSTSWDPVVWAAIGLAVMTVIIMWVYRSMQKPRLYLTYEAETGEPRATWKSLLRYVVLMPLMMLIWMGSLILILSIAADGRTAEDIALAVAAVIGAVRILAHMTPEGAHELGKTVPLAVLSIILLGVSTDPLTWDERWTALEASSDALDTQYLTLLVLDVVVTALWYWRVKATWKEERPNSVWAQFKAGVRPIVTVLRSIRDFGKTPASKAKPHGEMTAHV